MLQPLPSRRAYLRFGKGWHPVGLNVGECMSYAAAEAIPI
ncbi:MAG: hypothetical protein QOK09_437 [Mycobacterium sp.]|nr:hypothetical protein [Mycobacterium sp.]